MKCFIFPYFIFIIKNNKGLLFVLLNVLLLLEIMILFKETSSKHASKYKNPGKAVLSVNVRRA